ncbi:MAG TPA: lysine--tRNA ligase [Candidatus Acidoferrum sp.]|nr:lysine--tRNA ligase [Candidatus Acidoferrum sp.]
MAENLRKFISKMPYSYRVNASAARIKEKYDKYQGKNVSVAGRITGIRKSGKLIFIDILDTTGKIQAYFDFSVIGEKIFDNLKTLNSGDMIGVKGTVFKTTPGEISINVNRYKQLAKAIRMLPDKWRGLQDVELRYRKRHLDLIMNQESRKVAATRSMIVSHIRRFMEKKGFMEFETPVIQPLYGGADAEPFRVHVNTIDEDDYLRIANELYLKRLIIGGFDKVYEIYKAFRNEDIDTTHSPEFTMIEWYQSYVDYNDMMKLTEGLLSFVMKQIFKTETITYQGKKISMGAPFKRIKFIDSINEKVGKDVMAMSDNELFALAESKGIGLQGGHRNRPHAYNKLLEVLVQPELTQPTFVIDFPRETSPLTRPKRGNPKLVERFELYISGMEIANSYSELQNPIIQKENFDAEAAKSAEGDKEAEPLDMDFVEAMEYGMPPAGGLGMGIDRLTMLLTDKASIKEVILFPMEKRESYIKRSIQRRS